VPTTGDGIYLAMVHAPGGTLEKALPFCLISALLRAYFFHSVTRL